MNSYSKLSYAIAVILSGSAMGVAHADTVVATDASEPEGIQEITVTAQRRTESIQDVPITIQAISGESLKQIDFATRLHELASSSRTVSKLGN